ncbi:putative zinc metalloprotease [Bryobacterales bacterium F-183]|nr:putative zinc metalloprotease [Bryobacterales bacterium F-183]
MFSEFFASVWWMLILIGVMIIIHELGHYWAARFFDVKVDAFSFGFGPRLFGFKVGETDFRFSAILLGGYVKMAGEQPGDEADPRGFLMKPRWQRLIIAFAGPFMNILLAVAILTGLFMVRYQRPPMNPNPSIGYLAADGAAAKAGVRIGDKIVAVDGKENPTWRDVELREFEDTNKSLQVTVLRDGQRLNIEIPLPENEKTHIGEAGWDQERQIQIAALTPGAPAEKAGLKEGDLFRAINGQPIVSGYALVDALQAAAGKPSEIRFVREGKESTVTVTPEWKKVDPQVPERWVIGIQQEEAMEVTKLGFGDALTESVKENIQGAGIIYKFLRGVVERRMSPKSLEGPVGIARIAKRAARQGPMPFFLLMAMVSLNLAIFNLLPIPILDGGVILMLLVEMIRRQDLSLRVKEAVFKVGFAFLMMVVAFVLYNDISKTRADMKQEAPPARVQTPAPAKP